MLGNDCCRNKIYWYDLKEYEQVISKEACMSVVVTKLIMIGFTHVKYVVLHTCSMWFYTRVVCGFTHV